LERRGAVKFPGLVQSPRLTHDFAEWKDEIPWMSLYFSAAVWAGLALCVCYSLLDRVPRYRSEATIASLSSDALMVVSAARFVERVKAMMVGARQKACQCSQRLA
jgi:hypothetical protein